MTIADRLRRLAEALPASGSVVLTRADIIELLDEGGGPTGGGDAVADMTIPQVAERLKRAPSTIRNWIGEERLPGAYRLRGREWRIPQAALQAFLKAEAAGERPAARLRPKPADLGAWRKHLREAR